MTSSPSAPDDLFGHEGDQPRAEVSISSIERAIQPGQYVKLRCEIRNVGSTPFYIRPVIPEFTPEGGFKAFITSPQHPPATYSAGAESEGSSSARSIVEEVNRHWLLLLPGDFYGGTLITGIQLLEPGEYTIKGRRDPPQFSDQTKKRLRSALRFPILEEVIESNSVVLTVKN